MKKYFIAMFFGAIIITACSDDDDEANNTANACGNAANFCMKYDNRSVSGMAELVIISPTRYRIYYSDDANGRFEQVEIDIMSNGAGSFEVDTTYDSGTAAFEYFLNDKGAVTVQSGVSGTVQVNSYEPGGKGLSGSFSLTTKDGTAVSEGLFNGVRE